MIKSVVIFRRRPGMSVEAFGRHWQAEHAPLVCRLPGLRRYVQSQTLESAYRKFTPACDGGAERWPARPNTRPCSPTRRISSTPHRASRS